MSDFETVGKVDEFEVGKGKAVPAGGRMIAVFRLEDGFHAIDDLCPHMGASLAEGFVDEDTVTCPWHAWRFRVKDGTWCDNPKVRAEPFEVRVVDGIVQVRVDDN